MTYNEPKMYIYDCIITSFDDVNGLYYFLLCKCVIISLQFSCLIIFFVVGNKVTLSNYNVLKYLKVLLQRD